MTFAFVQGNTASDDANDATATVQLTSVGSSSVVVVCAKWEGAPTTISSINDTTGNATIYGTYVNSSNGDMSQGLGYYLLANSGTRTYTVTLAAARPFKRLTAMEFSYSGTASLDAVDNTAQNISSASIVTGAITTTGTDDAVAVFLGKYGSESYSAEQVGGVAAGGTVGSEPAAMFSWWRILSATMSSGTGTCTSDGTNTWVAGIIAFSAAGAAATKAPPFARNSMAPLLVR